MPTAVGKGVGRSFAKGHVNVPNSKRSTRVNKRITTRRSSR